MNFVASLFNRALAESSTASVICARTSFKGGDVYVNAAFEDLTGFTTDDVVSRGIALLHGEETDPRSVTRLQSAINDGKEVRLVIRSYRKDGSFFWNMLHGMPLRDESGTATHFMAMLRDVTTERCYAQRLERRAHHDELTDLPNRHLLYDRLDRVIAQAQQDNQSFALVFVDVNHFKLINDTFGHDIGDELLRLVAARLAHCVRNEDTVCRFGGDEFVLLLPQAVADIEVASIRDRISHVLKRPVIVDGLQIEISCSIGVSLYPKDGRDRTSLFRHADADMYHNKSSRTLPVPSYSRESSSRTVSLVSGK